VEVAIVVAETVVEVEIKYMEQKSFNVHDFLKDLAVSDIKDYCKRNTVPHALAMMHINGDFNLGTVIRNANFFGLEKVYYIGGKKQFDRRSTVGTHIYTPIEFIKTVDEFFDAIKGIYNPIALENNIKYTCHPYYSYKYPNRSVLIMGEEQAGLSDDVLTKCNGIVTIPGHGSVRSLNVGTASGIIAGHLRMLHSNV
jgi:tRNA G18 (ribose-2'-O)-methylase SpoU